MQFSALRNLYAYARGNPFFWIDPLGLSDIVFDGCQVTFVDNNGNVVRSCRAGSGLPGTGPDDQRPDGGGPIPEGVWVIHPWEYSGGWLRDLAWDEAWGRWRAPIHPAEGTDAQGRSGFMLRGDNRPDSYSTLGSVDVGPCDTWAHDRIVDQPDPVWFIVTYTQGTVCQ